MGCGEAVAYGQAMHLEEGANDMSTAETETLYTAADLEESPDEGYQYELVRGFLVREQAPGFQHARIVIRLGRRLEIWSEQAGTGYVTGEGGYRLESSPDTVRVPDVAFVRREQVEDEQTVGFVEGPPYLAIEVVSPNDRWNAIVDKVNGYFGAGVEQVWIVVPTNRTVMIHRSLQDITVLNDNDTIVGDGILIGLELPVADIFE